MFLKKIKQHSELIGIGIALAVLLLLFQFLEFKLLVVSHQFEIYVACVAVGFTLLGIWVAKKITTAKTIVVEKEVFILNTENFILNEAELSKRKISKRELEVLELMSQGLSNQEIAIKLFVSLNTVKTHSSNLFEKLDAKRRTQAVETAKKLQLIC